VPIVYVRARWSYDAPRLAWLSWSTAGGSLAPNRALLVPISDGAFHTYTVRLSDISGYSGWITGLELAPVSIDAPGTEVDVACISWKPCPVDRRAEAAIANGGSVPYLDSFDGTAIDPEF
jgi:hypothetical protein